MSSSNSSAPPQEAVPWLGVLGGAVAVAIWGGWISATRYAVTDAVDPLVLAMCRAGLPALVLAPVIWRRGLLPQGSSFWAILLMAIGWGAPFTYFVGTGLQTVPASLFGPIVPGMAPILVALLAWAILAERPGRALITGLILIGMANAIVLGQWLDDGDVAALSGVPFLLMSSLGISLYTVMFRRAALSPLEATAYISLYSLPMLALWTVADPQALQGLSAAEWGFHLLTQGLITGVGAVLAYGVAVRHLGAARGSTANAMVPVCAALVGVAVLGETMTALGWVAACLASLGVAAANGLLRLPGRG